MHGSYVNLAAAITTLANAIRKTETVRQYRNTLSRYTEQYQYWNRRAEQDEAFQSGVSYAIGMMLDADTASLIEQAARERAEPEDGSA